LPSSRSKPDARRKTFLNLSAQIEGQLRAAYDEKLQAGLVNKSGLAKKLGVNRSAISRRLMGHINMTTETIADMVWGLDYAIKVEIFDPTKKHGYNHFMRTENQPVPPIGGETASPKSELPQGIKDLLKANSAMYVGVS
jgi:hypothetical protein